jgi:hypothetical protein
MCLQTNLLARRKENLCAVEYLQATLTTITQQQIEYTCFNYSLFVVAAVPIVGFILEERGIQIQYTCYCGQVSLNTRLTLT